MERVVITGLGLVTPCGMGAKPTFQNLLNGRSGVGPITQFDATNEFATRFAAEVKGFDPSDWMAKKKIKETSRFISFAVAATRMALDDAEVAFTDEDRERAGCFIGVGLGGLENLEKITLTVHQKSPRKASPYSLPSIISNLAAGQVAIEFGLHGPSYCHTSACASGAHSIGEAYNWIRLGLSDVMVAGGAEATVTPVGVAGFSAMHALSRRNEAPERASRPFDKDRDGFVLGEGAGILVLESLTRARRRGARILAELAGWAASTDAYHLTRPPKDHPYAAKAMRDALTSAQLNPEQVGYVNAHGTSTPMGDVEESRAIAAVFGAHALDKRLWVSSTKSMMGHLLGASGAVEAAVAIHAVRTGEVPPTINLDQPDPECVLDYVPNRGRSGRVQHAMSNSFGFGGTNVALIVSRFQN
jgi:3-oxoacyl-[acyl-carrier-protein] synthase II